MKRNSFKHSIVLIIIVLFVNSYTRGEYFIKGNFEELKVNIDNNYNQNSDSLQKLFSGIEKYMEVPYKYGGVSETGVDCSGFVKLLFNTLFEIRLPHGSRYQIKKGEEVAPDKLTAGDLLFFRMGKTVGHVAVYLYDGFFVSAESKRGVAISHIDSEYWKQKFMCAKRVL